MSTFKSKLATWGLGILVLAIGAPIYFGVKHKMAEPAGATCTKETKCRGNSIFSSGMCLEDDKASYCTHECSADGDCIDGLKCEAVEGSWTTETTRGMHATQSRTTQGTKQICVKP
jgi:hypothetical protein